MNAEVRLWGRRIGAVAQEESRTLAVFEYDPEFAQSGIEVSPIAMPLGTELYSFPELPRVTFHGLPGLLADSLPDKFGNSLVDAWLATQGRSADSFSAVERLCYTGARGMGALEFKPVIGPHPQRATDLDVGRLVELATEILTHRNDLQGYFHDGGKEQTLRDILRVGTSAGGARAKAIIAWNPTTNEIRSGQIAAGDGFENWILKFDGVGGNKDKEMEDPKGYGVIEHAYYLMAKAAGIRMSECRLLEENGRRHFMTKRFDRLDGGAKLHMQSMCALGHYDFNQAGAYAYEQAFQMIRRLNLPTADTEEMFRRMAFNIVGRNQDDHVKNIAFLMGQSGQWSLAPAFDLTYSFNPSGTWTGTHQMTMNGKRDGFTLADFAACGRTAILKRGRPAQILNEVIAAVRRWPEFAAQARLPDATRHKIQAAHRLSFAPS